ncbi:MAG: RagB/SusD family nutrient uptake outer membrane protein [Bacteroidaceae bacterium]|nr:RagB/SusD family nutrient uptake outer membrane protein [Bacteroidaceae bacterium]
MKKIYLSLMLALGLGFLTSCEMDKKPFGSLDETTAIQNVNDLSRFRAGVYSSLRSMNAGGWITYQDIQMDQFHGLVNNGNRGGNFSNALFTSADGDIESMFAGCYSRIAKANYLIDKSAEMAASGLYKDKDADLASINRYKAEGHFLRAYSYFFLADHFSQPYAEVDPTQDGTGAMIVTHYNPTGDINAYPSRSSLAETYALIESDLQAAYEGLVAYEKTDASNVAPNAIYLSSYAVAAMQARVALVKGDYATAFAKAKSVIDSNVYTLATLENYADMWVNDANSEVIMLAYMSKEEGLASTGSTYTASTTETQADYIPTCGTLLNYLQVDGDIRFNTYFKVWNLDVEGSDYQAYVFLKYPGNPALRTTEENNYVNMPKVFRLSEMYLIAAEAACFVPEANGNVYLNALRANRIKNYSAVNYNSDILLSEVKKERELELLGEGFRMSDLRRWNMGFSRYASHDENPALNNVVVAAGRSMTYANDDHRFTWPIPKTEMDANPNLKGQQNVGY